MSYNKVNKKMFDLILYGNIKSVWRDGFSNIDGRMSTYLFILSYAATVLFFLEPCVYNFKLLLQIK